jgi:hypothetical protein
MKRYRGIAPRILHLGTRRRCVIIFTPGHFTPRGKSPGTHWIGWVGPTAGMDTMVKRKIPSPCRESNYDHPIVQPVAYRYIN